MPRVGSFGSASWNAFRSKGIVATFIAYGFFDLSISGTSKLITFAGASTGDLALITATYACGFSPNNVTAPAGWTKITNAGWPIYNYKQEGWYKVLTAGDIAAGSNFTWAAASNGGNFGVLIYRGATTVTAKTAVTGDGASGTLVLPGVAKSGSCRMLISYCSDRSFNNPATPTAWTRRLPYSASSDFSLVAAELRPNAYANGTTTTWPSVAGTEIVGQIYELS